MKRFTWIGLFVIVMLSLCCSNSEKPNILLILADDMGYSDIGCYGGEILTPNLDELAANGIRFTQFYNTARCCPTRASLMTGLYPHEAGVGHLSGRNMGPGYMGYLNLECVTLPELLNEEGYYTAMVGKWHAGTPKEAWAETRGFNHFYGTHNYIDSYFKVLEGCEVFEDGVVVIPEEDFPQMMAEDGKEWYTTDVFTTKALSYIDEAIDSGLPFFQYVAYNSPHWPLEAHDKVIAKYMDWYEEGYEQLRVDKYHNMRGMGILDSRWELPVQPGPDWNSLSDSAKEDTRFRRAIYAAQVDIMDQNIGRLVKHLKDRDVIDNTLIFFLSDNGCSAEPQNQIFGWQWENNTKWNYTKWRRNSAREGASQGEVWSAASNSPFRLHKRFTHEGGIASPLIIHWPEGVKNPNRWDRKPGHLIDIMPTILEVAGGKYPEEFDGRIITGAKGISLLSNIKNKKGKAHDAIFWEHEGHGAIRQGDWKLVNLVARDDLQWELYNLDNDRTETKNLKDQYPEKAEELLDIWKEWARNSKVLPWPDRANSSINPIDLE